MRVRVARGPRSAGPCWAEAINTRPTATRAAPPTGGCATRRPDARAAAGIAALALTGACSSSSSPSASTSAPVSAAAPSSAGAPSSAASVSITTTAAPGLGTILVDSTGRTIYRYDQDSNKPPTSNCSGGCAQAWPPVPATMSVTGVDPSLVGSITGSNGAKQLTIAGWPMYYYASDSAGQTGGQGVGGVWWVVGTTGAEIKGTASASASSSSGGGSGGGY